MMKQFVKIRKDKTDRKVFFLFFTCLALIFLGSFLCTWSRMAHIHMGYRLAAAYKMQRETEAQNTKLKSSEALLKSPSRIEEYARTALNLHYPGEEQVVMLKRN